MSDKIEAIAPQLATLLDAERARTDVDAAAFARAQHRMEVALSVSSALGTQPNAKATTSTSTSLASQAAKASTRSAIGFAAALAIGAGAGAAADALLRKSPPAQIVYIDRPQAPSDSSNAPAPIDSGSIPVLTPSDLPVAASAKPIPSATTNRANDGSLAGERLLLETARTALERGDATSALTALDTHAKKYPHGQLAEERDALSVQALVAAGKHSEAVARAVRFHQIYPSSMFAPAVDAAVGSTNASP